MLTIMDNSEISWPSVFWAVIAVALNAMSQPSGKTLGFPSKYSPALRCSPLLCGAHTVHTVLQLGHYSFDARSFQKALAKWVTQRFDGKDPNSSILNALNYAAHVYIIILFLVGAFLQAIKIFAAGGIAGTQIICSLYFASFCVDEILALSATKVLKSRDRASSFQPEISNAS